MCSWVGTQRAKKESLTEEQLRLLRDIDFVWNIEEWKWDNDILNLTEYYNKYGHSDVPQRFKENSLGGFITGLRRKGRKEILSKQQLRQLKELNFEFDVFEASFQDKCRKLAFFYKMNGHITVPVKEKELSVWINNIRGGGYSLTKERVKLLNKINFPWDPKSQH